MGENLSLYKNSALSELGKANIQLNAEQNQNMLIACQVMERAMKDEGITIEQVDKKNVNTVLEQVAIFNLNAIAIPSECYIILNKVYGKDANGKTDYKNFTYEFQFAPQGAGYEKLVRQFGADVKRLYPAWEVREGDEFKYPHYKGVEITAPEWTPTGSGKKIVKIVYVVEMTDGTYQYLISEREDVKKNLMAHVNRNLQYDQKDANEIIKKIDSETLDEALVDKEVIKTVKYKTTSGYDKESKSVSPAWYNPQNKESMIVTKMKNNVLKKFPKVFTNQFVQEAYDNSVKYDDAPVLSDEEKQVIDVSTEGNIKENIKKEANTLPSPTPDVLKKTSVAESKEAVADEDDGLGF